MTYQCEFGPDLVYRAALPSSQCCLWVQRGPTHSMHQTAPMCTGQDVHLTQWLPAHSRMCAPHSIWSSQVEIHATCGTYLAATGLVSGAACVLDWPGAA